MSTLIKEMKVCGLTNKTYVSYYFVRSFVGGQATKKEYTHTHTHIYIYAYTSFIDVWMYRSEVTNRIQFPKSTNW